MEATVDLGVACMSDSSGDPRPEGQTLQLGSSKPFGCTEESIRSFKPTPLCGAAYPGVWFMPHLQLFLERSDVSDLCGTLSSEPELAFLEEVGAEALPTGIKRWRARQTFSPSGDGGIAIWHIPSGPVVVRNEKIGGPDYLEIETPFDGWNSPPYTNEPKMPFLGNKPQFFELQIEIASVRSPELLGLSSISWIGSRYEKAPATAKLFWQYLQRLAKKKAKMVRGDGITTHAESSFLCWPEAFERIRSEQPNRIRT